MYNHQQNQSIKCKSVDDDASSLPSSLPPDGVESSSSSSIPPLEAFNDDKLLLVSFDDISSAIIESLFSFANCLINSSCNCNNFCFCSLPNSYARIKSAYCGGHSIPFFNNIYGKLNVAYGAASSSSMKLVLVSFLNASVKKSKHITIESISLAKFATCSALSADRTTFSLRIEIGVPAGRSESVSCILFVSKFPGMDTFGG
ncbi:hypothetical protein DERP_014946 [Dermatophagoides pteronyssinus]|uniref:Uncharacterized protein n=1 Tax=Dermatophagoides pteronyssinus TaxID=6956 RepID=A0ABQ8JX92_DERPT|nr:hypothetical protein DERP_014946 [Dermatophagoides pteronyssinus]